MKKSICISLATAFWLSFSIHSSAQSLRFGLKAGAGVAKFDYEPDTIVEPIDYFNYFGGPRNTAGGSYKPTYSLGGVLEYDLSKDFVLSTGIQASIKFSEHNVQYAYSREPNRYRFNVLYLQLPVTVHYRRGKFFAGAGGYAGWAVSGKWKNDVQDDSPAFSYPTGKLRFGDDPEKSNLPRFDYGLRGELGYGFKQLRLSLNFDQGIAQLKSTNGESEYQGNISDVEKGTLRNQAIYLTAAYYWLAK